ncbi:MAG: hypothetical protein ACREA0_15470 [bacterium]
MKKTTSFRLLIPIALLVASYEVRPEQPDFLMPHIPAFRTAALPKPPQIVKEIALPRVPESLPVFEVLPPPRPEEQVRHAAGAFELKSREGSFHRGRADLREETEDPKQQRSLTLFEASGGFFYMHNNRLYSPPEKQPKLPSEEEAHRLAMEFLRKRELLPEDALADLKSASFSRPRLVERDAKAGKKLQEIVTGIEVRFPQAWEGHRVTGPGSKLYVAFGEGGEILGVTRMWRQARKSEAALPSIPADEALELLRRGYGPQSFPHDCVKAVVQRMELAYWSENPRTIQRVGLPVYRIQGVCRAADERDLGEFEAYAPAVRNQPFEIRQPPPPTSPGDEGNAGKGPEKAVVERRNGGN